MRFGVCGFCLRWHIADGEVAKVSDFLSGFAIAWREALEQQLSDLVELARDTRSDKGRPAQWTHPVGSLVSEFAKRIAPPRPDACAGLIEAAECNRRAASRLQLEIPAFSGDAKKCG
jgi:hypothetical protein